MGPRIYTEVYDNPERVTGINFGNPEMQDIASVCKSARARKIAVLGWRMDVPLPDWLTTGATLAAAAPDLESAKTIVRP